MTNLEKDLLLRCANREDIGSSDRAGDNARKRLKKKGYIIFDRGKWRWEVTEAGLCAAATLT